MVIFVSPGRVLFKFMYKYFCRFLRFNKTFTKLRHIVTFKEHIIDFYRYKHDESVS